MIREGHWIFKFPYFKNFSAMTWEPHIYLNTKITDAMFSWQRGVMLSHEWIHIRQQQETGRKLFLFLYILKWFRNLFKYGPNMKAYYAIDWEREAYVLTTPGYLAFIGYEDLEGNPFEVKNEKKT